MHTVYVYRERALCCYVVYRGGNGNFSLLSYAVSGSYVKLKIATPSQDCRLDFWVMNGLGNDDYTQSCCIRVVRKCTKYMISNKSNLQHLTFGIKIHVVGCFDPLRPFGLS